MRRDSDVGFVAAFGCFAIVFYLVIIAALAFAAVEVIQHVR